MRLIPNITRHHLPRFYPKVFKFFYALIHKFPTVSEEKYSLTIARRVSDYLRGYDCFPRTTSGLQ
jgi:hypothetical protein